MGNIPNCCNEKGLENTDLDVIDNQIKFEKNWEDKELINACQKIQNHWRQNKLSKNKNDYQKNIHTFKIKLNYYEDYDEKIEFKHDDSYLDLILDKHKKEISSFLGNHNLDKFPVYKSKDYLYQGTFNENDEKDGIGRIYYLDKSYYYEGNFVNDKTKGRGFVYEKNYYHYLGDFLDNKILGSGYYISIDGLLYIGNFLNNKFEGEGLLVLPNKTGYFKGEFKDGKKNGYGELKLKNKGIFYGNFQDNKINGKGIYTFFNRNCYIGDFKDNKSHGEGIFIYSNGYIYEGETKNFKKEGKGKLIKFKKSFTQLLSDENRTPFKSIKYIKKNSGFEKIELPEIKLIPLLKNYKDYKSIDDRINNGEEFNYLIEGNWKNDILNGETSIKFFNNKIFKINYKNGIEKPYCKLNQEQIEQLKLKASNINNSNKLSIQEFNKLIFDNEHLKFYFIPYLIYKKGEDEILLDEFLDFSKNYYKRKKNVIKEINNNLDINDIVWNELDLILNQLKSQNFLSIKKLSENEKINKLIYRDKLNKLFEILNKLNNEIVNYLILKELFISTDEYKLKMKSENLFSKFKEFIKENKLSKDDKIKYIKLLKYKMNNEIEDEEINEIIKLYLSYQIEIDNLDDFEDIINQYFLNNNMLFDNIVKKIDLFEKWIIINDKIFESFDSIKNDKININFVKNNNIVSKNNEWIEFLDFIKFNNLENNENEITKQSIFKNLKDIINYLNIELRDITLKLQNKIKLNNNELDIIKEILKTNLEDNFNLNITLEEFFEFKNIKNENKIILNKLLFLYKMENINTKIIYLEDLIIFFENINNIN